MKKLLFSVAAVTLLFASCKKSDDNNSSVSRKDQLTTGKWQITGDAETISSMGASNTVDNYATSYDACEKDDLNIYRTDMHLISDEGTVKCSSSNPQQSDQGTWALTNSDTKIVYTSGSVTLTLNIDQLDANTLKLSEVTTQTISGITVTDTHTYTYKHVN